MGQPTTTPPLPPSPPVLPQAGHGGNTPDHDQARDFLDQELSLHGLLSASQRQDYRDAAITIIDQMTQFAVRHFNQNVVGYRFFPDLVALDQYFHPTIPSGTVAWLV